MEQSESRASNPLKPEHLEALTVFPLPNTVFFPHTALPLHIFEPRYRVMTQELLEQQRPLSVVLIDDSRGVDELGRPVLHRVAGVGEIIHHQQMPDGRYNILVEGVSRVRILEELDVDTPYRQVRAERLDDVLEDQGQIHLALQTLRGCVLGINEFNPRLGEALARTMNNLVDPGAIADTLASVIYPELEQRQQLLNELRVDARLDDVLARITELLAMSQAQGEVLKN